MEPTPIFWPGEFHGLYSPWGHKKLDTTKRLSFDFNSSKSRDISCESKKQEFLTSDVRSVSKLLIE